MNAPISDEELLQMAGNIAPGYYLNLGVKLGQTLARLEQILQSKNNDYFRSIVAILMMWRDSAIEGESWGMKRSKLGDIFHAVGIGGVSGSVTSSLQSKESLPSGPALNTAIPEPEMGIPDAVLKEIAENLETDDQIEYLARALRKTQTQINQCHATNRLTGSVTTRGTVEMLTSWKATVRPEIQMSCMHSAMTSARLIYLRDTVLAKAEKQLEEERQAYQRQLMLQQQQKPPQQAQQHIIQRQQEKYQSRPPPEPHKEMVSSAQSSAEESAFSSLCSAEPRVAVSAGRPEEAGRKIEESRQRNAPPSQPHPLASSTSASYQPECEHYDIYLVYSQETEHVRRVKDIIRKNEWTMITNADRPLGWPKMASIEEALKTCSHLVRVITKEDCDENDTQQTMTREMAFQLERALEGRVISIRCCEERYLPLSLRSLTNIHITDVHLESRLKDSINVRRKKRKEGGSTGPSLTQMSSTHPAGDTASSVNSATGSQSVISSQLALVEQSISRISLTSSTHNSGSQLTGESVVPQGSFDPNMELLTPSHVASQIERFLLGTSQPSSAPNSTLNVHGNVINIGTINIAGNPGPAVSHPAVVPPHVLQELSKLLNVTRVTNDDWTELACAFHLADYIDSFKQSQDPTRDVISRAEEQKKLCSLDDLRDALVSMKRDDCVEVLDQHTGPGESSRQRMLTDRDRGSSSSDEY